MTRLNHLRTLSPLAFCLILISGRLLGDDVTRGVVDCAALLMTVGDKTAKSIPPDRRHPDFALHQALQELRSKSGKPNPMTIEELDRQSAELALYLLGKKTGSELKKNRFFSDRSQKPELDIPLKSLLEEDIELIKSEINRRIEKHIQRLKYGDRDSKAVEGEIEKSTTVVIANHQMAEYQEATVNLLTANDQVAKLPVVWLVGAESSDPLKTSAFDHADLIRHSVGGEFNFSLAGAELIYLSGGAMDQCLVQTISSTMEKTNKPVVTIKVLKPITFLEHNHTSKITLTEFLKLPLRETAKERREFAQEIFLMVDDNQWKPSGTGRLLGETLTLKRRDRTVVIEFVDAP